MTECAQNVHHEPCHKQRDGDATDWWSQQQWTKVTLVSTNFE